MARSDASCMLPAMSMRTADADEPTGGVTTGGSGHAVAEFGGTFTVIGTAKAGLNVVRDLAFNPKAPEPLWKFNMLSHGTVSFFDPATASTRSSASTTDAPATPADHPPTARHDGREAGLPARSVRGAAA